MGAGPEAVWRGTATVAGSWIGGSANQTALHEIFGAGPDVFSIWIAVDVVVANIWRAVVLWIAANQRAMDRLFRADTTAVDRVRVILMFGMAFVISSPSFFLGVGSMADIGGAAFHPSLAPVGVLLAVVGYIIGTAAAWFTGLVMMQIAAGAG